MEGLSEDVKGVMERKSAMLGYENISMFSNYQFSYGDVNLGSPLVSRLIALDVSANHLTCL